MDIKIFYHDMSRNPYILDGYYAVDPDENLFHQAKLDYALVAFQEIPSPAIVERFMKLVEDGLDELTQPKVILEYLWSWLQAGHSKEGTTFLHRNRLRSMSMGDEVEINEQRYRAVTVGWERVN